MRIRAAQPSDLAQVAALYREVALSTLATFTTVEKTVAEWEQALSGAGAFLVAMKGDQLLGYATYGAFRSGPGYRATAEHSIYLAASARGRGVGRALLQALEASAREAGIHVMVAAISGANPDAMRFHAACGYAETAHMPQVGQKWGHWLDLVLMQKILKLDDDLAADRGGNAS